MSISIQCSCGRKLKARDEFAGTRAECPTCGKTIVIPAAAHQPGATAKGENASAAATSSPAKAFDSVFDSAKGPVNPSQPVEPEPMDIVEFLDPPQPRAPSAAGHKSMSLRMMFEALLDPRSIQWMLMLGGGLLVLGAIIWLVSKKVFDDPKVLAAALGAGSLAILGLGWWLELKTRFRTAGQALTFLGCIIAPLNLWFYDAQNLITIEGNLWVGGVICCLIYAVTVFVLRDPLFMYAVEGGVTLTLLLLLANLNKITDTSFLCLFLTTIGLISIHGERAFPPGEEGTFTRRKFGMPLFWSGHVQLASGLLILLGSQCAAWLFDPRRHISDWTWEGNSLTHHSLLAGGLWLAGMYAYFYSDLVVRRVGVYTYIAAICLLMAEITLVWDHLEAEGVIAVMALTALAANLVRQQLKATNEKLDRAIPPLALGLSALPVVLGIGIHLRATSALMQNVATVYETGWLFVAVLLLVAVCNRISAYLFRRDEPTTSAVYFFFSAGSLIVAAAGLLRQRGITDGLEQAALLMLIPLGYLIAARLWRGRSPERPLVWVAHAATAAILMHALLASLDILGEVFQPVLQHRDNLLLGAIFSEAAIFYVLAGIFRKRSANVYFASASACAALWQFIGYYGQIDHSYYTMLYAVLGIGVLAAGRSLGIEKVATYDSNGTKGESLRGRGLALFQSGNSIVFVALLAAFWQGLAYLARNDVDWGTLSALMLTTVASYTAIALVPVGNWRRLYWTSSFALTGLCFLTLQILSTLTGWQKLEIFGVIIGTVMVVAGYIGRFREAPAGTTRGSSGGDSGDSVSLGLWIGSLLVTAPLTIAMCVWRFHVGEPHWPEELAIVTFTILMLVTGFSWQIKATTVAGSGTLFFYLLIVIGHLAYRPQVATGVYLVVGGSLVFMAGLILSIYRDKLLALPDRIAKREGIFQVIGWR